MSREGMSRVRRVLRRWGWLGLIAAVLGGYWLLPISGQVLILPEGRSNTLLWPQMRLEPASPRPGQEVTLQVMDAVPWTYVLLTVDGRAILPERWPASAGDRLVWEWSFTAPDEGSYPLVFYHDCDTGCIERGRLVVGSRPSVLPAALVPTKLGVVFADPARDWHGRSGWDVELTYARLAGDAFWGIDDLAGRVSQAAGRGLRVLVRVDYDQGQSLPPADDQVALNEYLTSLRRLARDERLEGVYGYVLGSGFNELASNSQDPDHPVTPEWYARLFNGYGQEVSHTDNAVQVIRAENPQVRVLVGPVRPWNEDQDGARPYAIDVPWLNYMNTLVAALDAGARAKSVAGYPLATPDGFGLHVPGRPEAAVAMGREGAEEPHLDLRRPEWGQAQAGFRVYRDWLAIVNAYPTTRGLPVYITSTNTYAPGGDAPPAQNYPAGWLRAAMEEVNQEPQVQALCWFVDEDRSGDDRWDLFSLAGHPGRLIDAADEFDALLGP
jgi:hypothetical protein